MSRGIASSSKAGAVAPKPAELFCRSTMVQQWAKHHETSVNKLIERLNKQLEDNTREGYTSFTVSVNSDIDSLNVLHLFCRTLTNKGWLVRGEVYAQSMVQFNSADHLWEIVSRIKENAQQSSAPTLETIRIIFRLNWRS